MKFTTKEIDMIKGQIESLYFTFGDAINELEDKIEKDDDGELFVTKKELKRELRDVKQRLKTLEGLNKKMIKLRNKQ